jgi:flavin reductase (DIM6/NTAB) family NADH-FMN oxidoreductase RutF
MDRGDETMNATPILTTPTQLSEHQLSAEEFRHAFQHHPAGVAVGTADAGDGPVAMTVSSVASVEVDPLPLVFSASGRSSATPTIRRGETGVGCPPGSRTGANSWLRGRVVDRIDLHGSTLVAVEATDAEPRNEQALAEPKPLVYHDRKWFALGERLMVPETTAPFLTVYKCGE